MDKWIYHFKADTDNYLLLKAVTNSLWADRYMLHILIAFVLFLNIHYKSYITSYLLKNNRRHKVI